MTWLIVLASIAAYFLIGALYARSRVIDTYRRAKKEFANEDNAREAVLMVTFFRVLLWPFYVPFDAIRGGIRTWVLAPVQTRKDQAAQLREDAHNWYVKAVAGGISPAEREMAAELHRICGERAKEVDL